MTDENSKANADFFIRELSLIHEESERRFNQLSERVRNLESNRGSNSFNVEQLIDSIWSIVLIVFLATIFIPILFKLFSVEES